ncbi:MAG: threonine synthase [Deltaproteobacteria bacterium]|jgi:threonine synthase|nr:threonine synthase [Deltaproteobacteria bacterium]
MNGFPAHRGDLRYVCTNCSGSFPGEELLYTCPACSGVLLLEDAAFASLKECSGAGWREIFDARAALKIPALSGIFRFYEILAPVMEEEDIICLGEGNTPVIPAAPALRDLVGADFAFKNEGQNPSASFKDRGMACAFSYLKSLIRKHQWSSVLTICASTGDTSASAAMYAAYMGEAVKSVVLLPEGKVTPQQLAQPLGSGARVLEIPGVFDDCMKVVEFLAERYPVALLNSKNSWRILGQESYAFELAQWRGWDMQDVCVFIPIGNAGNITAVMQGFLKLYDLKIITALPRIFGVQSQHADPVYRYYAAPADRRRYAAVPVKPSVAQAAMIGNPVSFPRVRLLAGRYEAAGGPGAFQVMQVTEQAIMDSMLEANRHGHIVCPQGGECLAGLKAALEYKLISSSHLSILAATAHALKFVDFQNTYFSGAFPPGFGITPRPDLINSPEALLSSAERQQMDESRFISETASRIAGRLGLAPGRP